MSGTAYTPSSAGFSTAPLADAEKADVRRFCGYSAYGNGAQSFSMWVFSRWYTVLEFRMANLAPAELQTLRMILTELAATEQALFGARGNLDTDQAAVWRHNRGEVSDRWGDFNRKRRHLAAFIGVPDGDSLKAQPGGLSSNVISI
jgi:hypothetical protein